MIIGPDPISRILWISLRRGTGRAFPDVALGQQPGFPRSLGAGCCVKSLNDSTEPKGASRGRAIKRAGMARSGRETRRSVGELARRAVRQRRAPGNAADY